jgi:hypothetical protein
MLTIIYFKSTDNYDQAVVGESNYQSQIDKAFQEDGRFIEVSLILEPHNQFDQNAVAVSYGADTFGYLSSTDALTYCKSLLKIGHPNAMGICKAKIVGGRDDRSYGVILDLDLQNLQIEKVVLPQQSQPAVSQPAPRKRMGNGTIFIIGAVSIGILVICGGCLLMIASGGNLQIPTSAPPPVSSISLTMTAFSNRPTPTPLPTWTPAPTSTPEKLAWTACIYFIEQKLKLSALFDAQAYNPGGVIKAGNDFLVDVYYAKNDVTYTCLITRDPNGDWRLLNLEKK